MSRPIILLLLVIFIFLASARIPCRRGEEYKRCPGCPPTCQTPKPQRCFMRCSFRCVCRQPYILDTHSGICVRHCPSRPTTETTILTTSHNNNPYNGTFYYPSRMN